MTLPEVPNIPSYREEITAEIPFLQAYADGKRVETQLLDGSWVRWSPSEVLDVARMRIVETDAPSIN